MSDRTIFKIHKAEANFSIIPNETVQNDTLSFKATGLLCYLLSLPENWNINLTDLVNRKKDGRDAIRSAFMELRDAGYAKLVSTQDEKGQLTGKVWHIYASPTVGKPDDRFSRNSGELPLQRNIETKNTEEKENKAGRSAPFKPPTIEEVREYAEEIGLAKTEVEKFMDFYASKGWRVGRVPMKDWRAALRNWKRNANGFGAAPVNGKPRIDRGY